MKTVNIGLNDWVIKNTTAGAIDNMLANVIPHMLNTSGTMRLEREMFKTLVKVQGSSMEYKANTKEEVTLDFYIREDVLIAYMPKTKQFFYFNSNNTNTLELRTELHK